MKSKFSEVELAEPVVGYFESLKHDVYQEVSIGSNCADIVSVLGKIVTIIEVKRSLTIALLDQAYSWNRLANYVYIAVPRTRDKARYFAYRICRDYGIGVLIVDMKHKSITEKVPAQLHRKSEAKKILGALRPEHKTHCKAGSQWGQWTPFQGTCRALCQLVKNSPGITLDEAIKSIKHHYSSNASAKHSLTTWIFKGIIDGVKLEQNGKTLKLYPK